MGRTCYLPTDQQRKLAISIFFVAKLVMELPLVPTLKLGITLISILNPLGAIPTYLILTKDMNAQELKGLTRYCSITVMATLIISLWLGKSILSFFGISIPSFTIGGGILLATIAFNMISAQANKSKMSDSEIQEKIDAKEVGVVPLAIPLLSGPGSISSCIIASRDLDTIPLWIGALIVVLVMGFLINFIFAYARNIGNKLGTVGLNIMTRIMGIILLSSSIEMIIKGLKEVFPKIF